MAHYDCQYCGEWCYDKCEPAKIDKEFSQLQINIEQKVRDQANEEYEVALENRKKELRKVYNKGLFDLLYKKVLKEKYQVCFDRYDKTKSRVCLKVENQDVRILHLKGG